MALLDNQDSASGSVTNADKARAGGKLPAGSSVNDRVRNGAAVADKAVANAKKGG